LIRLFSSAPLLKGMVAMIPYEGSFELKAYATGPGWQSIVPQGYVYYDAHGDRYVAPLIPELFYGVTGEQLQHTWRQYIPSAGEHVILSRRGGYPQVPRSELYWRKITPREAALEEAAPPGDLWSFLQANWLTIAGGLGAIAAIVATAYYISHW